MTDAIRQQGVYQALDETRKDAKNRWTKPKKRAD